MLQLNKQDVEDILANKKIEIADLRMVTEYASAFRKLLMESSIEEQKTFIREFIRKIKVTGDNVELVYIMLLPSEKTKVAEFLAIEQIGSASLFRAQTR